MILVTGGCGFIGKYVCSRLAKQGKELVILDRKVINKSNAEGNCYYEECDIRSKDQIEHVFKKYTFTVVVHLAAMLQTASQNIPIESANVNVLGGLYLLEKACQSGVPRLIFGSSISVYGSKLNSDPPGVNENDPANPEDIYAVGKRYIEIAGEAYSQKYGATFLVLRIGSVIGPGAENTSSKWRSEIFEKLQTLVYATIDIPYRNDSAIPLVHVEDVADMINLLIDAESPKQSIYNAPSETWSLKELAQCIKSANSNVNLVFGVKERRGFPGFINGKRFSDEFGYKPVPLKERFQQYLSFERVT